MGELDETIRERAGRSTVSAGDVVTGWVAIASVRHVDGGGYVVTIGSDDIPPMWQIRGMLTEALSDIDTHKVMAYLSTEDD